MDQNITQAKMSPDQAKASMGIATHLMSRLLPQTQPEASPATETPNPDQGVPTNQQNGEETQAQIQGLESRLMDELQTLRTEMKAQGDGQQELSDLKKQIEAVLNSNE